MEVDLKVGGFNALTRDIAWLAFCSGTYMRRLGRVVPLVVVDLRHSPDGFAYSDKTVTFGDELGLPQQINLFASEILFEASVKAGPFEGKRDVDLWKRGDMGFKWEIPEGALRFRYFVSESTDISGWHLPLKFEWFWNVLESGKLVVLGRGTVTQLSNAKKPESVIMPELHPSIVDWRFVDPSTGAKGLVYLFSSVLPTNHPAFQKRSNARQPEAPVSAKRSVIGYGLIAFLLLTPLISWGVYHLRRQTRQQSK